MPLVIHIILVLLFIILGVVFYRGKGSFLISGYNTASKAEKEKIDESRLCRFMGRLMLALAGCWLIIAFGDIFKTTAVLWIGAGLFLASAIGAVVYMNTGNRFRK